MCTKMASIITKIKNFWNPTDIYTTYRPIFYITFLAGITPVRIVGNEAGDRKLVVSNYGFIATLFHIILFGICYIYTIEKKDTIVGYFFQSGISLIGDTLQMFTTLFALIIIIVYCLIRRYVLINCVHQLAKIDEELHNIGIEINFKKMLNFIFITIFIKAILYITYLCGSYKLLSSAGLNPGVSIYVSFFLPHLMISLVVVLFMCLVQHIYTNFYSLNKVLKSMYDQIAGHDSEEVITSSCMTPSSSSMSKRINKKLILFKPSIGISSVFSSSTSIKTTSDAIITISRIHDQLCDAASSAEYYFTTQMLTIITIAFMIIVFNSYYMLEAFFGNESSEVKFERKEFVSFFAYQLIMYAIGIFGISYVSSSAELESENTTSYVHKILNLTNDEDLKEKLMQFSLQLVHRRVKFTACGMFTLDRTLIFTVVGAASTYLIILVQFTFNEDSQMLMLKNMLLSANLTSFANILLT